MALQENLAKVTKSKLTQLKALLEELEVQMALGKAEAKDLFEKERKNFQTFLGHEKTQLRDAENVAIEHRQSLLKSLEALEAQLSKELPQAKRKFDKQKTETLESIYRLEEQFTKAYGDVSYNSQQQLDDFKVKLDAYRVKLALGNIENENELANRKSALKAQVDTLRTKLQDEVNSEDRIEQFVNEVSESFDHMKKAFNDLFA